MSSPVRRLGVAVALLLLVHAMPSPASSQTPADPPSISPLRQNEDYTYLEDREARSGAWWEGLKHIRLGTSEAFLTLGGEVRSRAEYYGNNGWESGIDDAYLLLRTLPYADLKMGRARLFGQIIAAKSVGVEGGPGPTDETGIDLLQGFAEARLGRKEELQVRAGRQLLSYGTERLIGTRYGPNVLQPFDGFAGSLALGSWRVDAIAVRPVQIGRRSFDDASDDRRGLWSLYATAPSLLAAGSGMDLYYIGYENEAAAFNEGRGRELRHTLGSRLFGRKQGWSWDIEAFYQFGSFGGGNVNAWSVATDVRKQWPDRPLQPFLQLRANIISGDDKAGDGKLQTFNALFPKGKYFGEIGLLGPYNLINLHPIAGIELGSGLSARAAAVFYWRESLGDGIYGVSGRLQRPAGGSRSRYIGTQSEIVLAWSNGRTLDLEFAASLFRPGAFLEDTGSSSTVRFLGAEALFRF